MWLKVQYQKNGMEWKFKVAEDVKTQVKYKYPKTEHKEELQYFST